MPIFTVVAKSRASAIFYSGKSLAVEYVMANGKTVLCKFTTGHVDASEVPLPTDLYIEARGEADDLLQASREFYGAILEATNVVAFTTNAYLGNPQVELVFDSSPDLNEHYFVQTFVPHVPITVVPSRPINPELVRDFLSALHGCTESRRVLLAVGQYCIALRQWSAGNGIICLAHLYMGVEALTKAVLRDHILRLNLSENDLVKNWVIDKKQLDSEVRKRLIFNGDEETFKIARSISDSFEHGFGDFSKMHKPAGETVVQVAGYVRATIIALVGVDPVTASDLLSAPYDKPRGPIRLIKKVKGTLIGRADELQMKGRAYPVLNWSSTIKKVWLDDGGKYNFEPSEQFSPELGDGVVLRLDAFEGWDDQLLRPDAVINHFVPMENGISVAVKKQNIARKTILSLMTKLAFFFKGR